MSNLIDALSERLVKARRARQDADTLAEVLDAMIAIFSEPPLQSATIEARRRSAVVVPFPTRRTP